MGRRLHACLVARLTTGWTSGGEELVGTIVHGSLEENFHLDGSCWNIEYTVERCCLVSINAAVRDGCFDDKGVAELHETCCQAFLVWKPPPRTSALRLTYDIARRQIMDARNQQHEGMVFGRLAAELGYMRCAEVGVLSGVWSEFFLVSSTSVDGRLASSALGEVREYTLVDLWISHDSKANYRDVNSQKITSQTLTKAINRLERFWPRVRFVQQASARAARLFEPASLDFVFIDARHDGCAVQEDLQAWWPKVRPGGLLAGDDYLDAETAALFYQDLNDWSICESGEVRPGATRGAVDVFASNLGLEVNVFRLPRASLSPQWLIFKPFET